MDLLHIIPALGPGGPSRSLVALTKHGRISHPQVRHRVIALRPGDYLPMRFELRRQGISIARAAELGTITDEVERAEVVLLHFWNTPDIWRLIAHELPAARYVLWSTVLGAHSPQKLNARLSAGVGELVLTAPAPPRIAAQRREVRVIPGLVDRERVAGIRAKPHEGFNADYIGTTNRGKMHPRFIEMMARLDIPDLRVRICGGALEPAMAACLDRQANADRFECLGFVEAIASILETTDVFAYPLAERTYATSDISLQEAMLAGIPPVILPHGGPSRFVVDGKSGIVARSEDEFVAAIEHLYRHPEKRHALGREARRSAETRLSPERHAADLLGIIEDAAGREKAPLLGASGLFPETAPSAATLFLISQDWDASLAQAAVAAWRAGRMEQLSRYADELDDDAFQVEGGILHWRNEALDDPILRSWTAVWLRRHGRIAEAEREAAEAIRLGAPATGR